MTGYVIRTQIYEKMGQLDTAKNLAIPFMTALQPYCKRIELVGQLAQLRETVDRIDIICTPQTEKVIWSAPLFPDVAPKTKETYCEGFMRVIRENGKKLHGSTECKHIIIRLGTFPTNIYVVPEDGFGLAQVEFTSNMKLWNYTLEMLRQKGLYYSNATQLLHYRPDKYLPIKDDFTLFKEAGINHIPLNRREKWAGIGCIPAEVLV